MVDIVKAEGGLCGEHYIKRNGKTVGCVNLTAGTEYESMNGRIQLYNYAFSVEDLHQIAKAVKDALNTVPA